MDLGQGGGRLPDGIGPHSVSVCLFVDLYTHKEMRDLNINLIMPHGGRVTLVFFQFASSADGVNADLNSRISLKCHRLHASRITTVPELNYRFAILALILAVIAFCVEHCSSIKMFTQ